MSAQAPLPIRIKAGVLEVNVPARDLLLSPDHALLIDDVLIRVGALVNGICIVRGSPCGDRQARPPPPTA